MNLYEVQQSAHHGTNQSVWIDVDKICSIEQHWGKAVITLIGGSKVTVTYFQTFRKFVDSIIEHATFREDEDEYD